eukprot:1219390-Prorocentrum_lima.AAC.1
MFAACNDAYVIEWAVANEQQGLPWGGPIMASNVFTWATVLQSMFPGGAPVMVGDVFTWAS